jgi:hypothetical protein
MTLPSLTWPELLCVLLGSLLVLNAARRGFLREGSLLLSLLLAVWLAGRLYAPLNAVALAGASGGAWPIGLYAGLFAALLLACLALSSLLVPLIRNGPLGAVDRLGGLAVGLAEAAVVLGLLVTAAERFGHSHAPADSPAGRTAAFAARSVALLGASLPLEVAPFAEPSRPRSVLPLATSPR